MKKSDLVVCKTFETRDDLLKFLNELDKKYNLSQIIIQIIKTSSWTYELFYIDYSLETEQDRLL